MGKYTVGQKIRFRPLKVSLEARYGTQRGKAVDGTVIFVHPRGRFIVVEYIVRPPLGGRVALRETLLTPECNKVNGREADREGGLGHERGMLRKEDLKAPPVEISDEEKNEVKKPDRSRLSRAEKLETR